jgi:hypothetical protein
MEYRDVRELVRIRHELRNLAVDRDRQEAATLLDRMCALVSRDAVESAALQPEVQRWQWMFRLVA